MNGSTPVAFVLMLTIASAAGDSKAAFVVPVPDEPAKAAANNRPDEQFLRSQRMQRDNARSMNSGAVDSGVAKLSDLVQLNLEGDLLTLETGAGGGARSERYQLKNLDAYVVITRTTSTPVVMANGVVRPSATSVSVSRIDTRVTEDEAIWSSSISQSSTYLSITGRSVLGQVSFSQSMRANVAGVRAALPVRLTVYEWQAGPRQRSVFTATANTVEELRRQHPVEFRKYLVPLFRKFSNVDWLVPGATDAYAVFSYLKPQHDVVVRLQELLPELDSDSYEVRQAAAAKLMELGAAGVLAALRMNPATLSDEQKGQLGRLIAAHRRRDIVNATGARKDPMFLADCLEHPDQAVRKAAIAALEKLTAKKLPFDAALQGNALTAAADEVRKQVQELIPATQPATQPAAGPVEVDPEIIRPQLLIR